jgi:two-component system chemotaxis response regulator CheB/chemosensory pili system protein ChpB (putative protein-glutamate methylesterase)
VPNHDLDEPVSVALLYQTSQLEGHLKDALNELGAAVVYEALTAEMDRDALEGSGAHVVIVNLDPEIESHLDEVYDLLDDERYNVVFNDAQVSSSLSGWEQARWSRHLAAKIMGRPEVADPPRPAGAEAPPSPAQKIARSIPDVPVQPPPQNIFVPDAQSVAMFPPDGDIANALGDLLETAKTPSPQLKPVTPDPGEIASPDLVRKAAPPADFNFDFDALVGDIPTAAVTSRAAPTVDDTFDLALPDAAPKPAAPAAADLSFDFDLGALDAPAEPVVAKAAPAADFGLGDDFGGDAFADLGSLDSAKGDTADFASDLDNLFGDAPVKAAADGEPTFDFDLASAFGETSEPSAQGGVEVVDFDAAMSDLAGSIPGSRELPSADELGAATMFDLPAGKKPAEVAREKPAAPTKFPDWGLEPVVEGDDDAAPPPAASTPKVVGVEKISAAESLLAGSNWSLEDISDSDPTAAPTGPAPTGPAKFGLEKMEAQDYLAPEGGEEAKFDFDTSLKLDLIPMEEAVSHDRPELVSEHRLDESSGVFVRNVIVLGASIGGPEAVREYLAALPARFPALFVLAQHMGAEFLELMAAQLAKATPLTVRSPQHGDRASHGEILVVPTTHRLLIEPTGVVQLAHLPEASPYTPSIDLVIRDIADRFKTSATAIIFSGMAHDAIEGSKHLASLGGKVWAQDPDTCVISSMVDGARDAGIVSFTGSPAELAQHTIRTFKA